MQLVKIIYEIDEKKLNEAEIEDLANEGITGPQYEVVQNTTIVEAIDFTGDFYEIEIIDEFVIVSSADSESPGVYFYDHEWNMVKKFGLIKQEQSPYNLEVHSYPEMGTIQVYVAGRD